MLTRKCFLTDQMEANALMVMLLKEKLCCPEFAKALLIWLIPSFYFKPNAKDHFDII